MSTHIAIVHERLTEVGGSERVLGQMAAMWPSAHIFTPIADDAVRDDVLGGRNVAVSGLQRLYRGGDRYAHLLPLLPTAMARADLSDADLVITSHHAFANRVRPRPGVPVLSYTHTPARWMWDGRTRVGEASGRLGSAALTAFAASQVHADRRAATRVASVVVNSRAVADRVRSWWGRASRVVPPPVDTDWYSPDPTCTRDDFFLLAGRLVPYKRAAVAVEAAARAGVALVVAGDGRSRQTCEAAAGPTTEFVGRVSDRGLRDLYRRCRALVFPGIEDFGIVPVEAQACGAPVIGLAEGGLLDSVIDGVTGTLVRPARPTRAAHVEAFADALRTFDDTLFESHIIRNNAETFSAPTFRSRFGEAVEAVRGAAP